MASSRPVVRGQLPLAAILLIASFPVIQACASRPPRLVPPAAGVEAVEGFGSASVSGADASIKGKFGFVFRRPGLGRIEAVDPLGRTVFLIVFRDDRGWFVLPGRKIYAEDGAAVMMERFLGVGLVPDEAVRLLSGSWGAGEAGGDGAWVVERDAEGRGVSGVRDGFALKVRTFFPGGAVPREIAVEGPGASGRIKVLKLGFNPPPREAAFDTAFLKAYAPKTWEEILDLIDR
jgi:hypothetical protein